MAWPEAEDGWSAPDHSVKTSEADSESWSQRVKVEGGLKAESQEVERTRKWRLCPAVPAEKEQVRTELYPHRKSALAQPCEDAKTRTGDGGFPPEAEFHGDGSAL